MSKFDGIISTGERLIAKWFPNTPFGNQIQVALDTIGTITITKNGKNKSYPTTKLLILTLEDLIEQLKDIDCITYTIGDKYPLDYFDLLIARYNWYQASYRIKHQEFLKTIQDLFNDLSKEETLRKLGAKKEDFYIMRHDSSHIQEMANDNTGLNIFEIANKFRLINISPLKAQDLFELKFNLDGHQNLSWKEFLQLEFVYTPSPSDHLLTNQITKLAIFISDAGVAAWNSKMLHNNYKDIIPTFNKVILYGDGNHNINLDTALDLLNKANADYQNLESAMIVLLKHRTSGDYYEMDNFINNLPNSFSSKQTIYVIDSCYGGKYHEGYNKKACLISFNDGKHVHYINDSMFYYSGKLAPFLDANPNSLSAITEFYTSCKKELFLNNDTYVSGEINGKMVNKKPIYEIYNELHPEMPSQQSESPNTTLGDVLDYAIDNCTIM